MLVDEQRLWKQHHLAVIDRKFNVGYCPVIISQISFLAGVILGKLGEHIGEKEYHNHEMQMHQQQITRKETPTKLKSVGGLFLTWQSDLS